MKRYGDWCEYQMRCVAHGHPASYSSGSWLGLGWQIFKHRLYHLLRHGMWTD